MVHWGWELRFRKASFSVTCITSVLPVTRGESPVGLYDGGSVVLVPRQGMGSTRLREPYGKERIGCMTTHNVGITQQSAWPRVESGSTRSGSSKERSASPDRLPDLIDQPFSALANSADNRFLRPCIRLQIILFTPRNHFEQ